MKNPGSSFLKAGGWTDLLVLTALWCLAIILVNPIGNFPLNDDWSYGLTVKFLHEHGDFRPAGWTCMTYISEALWGDLFCLPAGFSFTAVRFSTITISWIGLLGFYVLIRQLGQPRRMAFACALLLAFNPLYFALSNSFMSDVPFTTMAIFSLLLYVRYFQTESIATLAIALGMTIVATLCRQLGMAMPLAFTITLLLKRGFQRHNLVRALTPSVVTIGVWVGYNHWLKASGRMPAIYNEETDKLLQIVGRPWTVPLHLAHHGWNALMYLGCFLLPLLLLLLPAGKRLIAAWWAKAALGVFAVWSLARFVAKPGLMPVHGNVLDPHGIGPLLLQDTQLLNLPHVTPLPKVFWAGITALSLIGAGLLLVLCARFLVNLCTQPTKPESSDSSSGLQPTLAKWANICRNQLESTDHTIAVFFLVCALIYVAPLVIAGFFDRYLIPLIVLLVAFLVTTMRDVDTHARPWQRYAFMLLLLGSAAYAVAGTKDYLAWNRTRWVALADLQHNGVAPQSIDGGLEFNAWYFYDPNYKPNGNKSDWWVIDNQYLLSFGDMAGFTEFKEYDYRRWLPPSHGKILVLKRNPDQSAGK